MSRSAVSSTGLLGWLSASSSPSYNPSAFVFKPYSQISANGAAEWSDSHQLAANKSDVVSPPPTVIEPIIDQSRYLRQKGVGVCAAKCLVMRAPIVKCRMTRAFG
eukprot:Hpha_TRINITY_DN33500_c0_g1::TRINITY_DN33500_c0_g1_i1::g.170984::m.170984